jgi:hypothetical protein
MCLIHGGALLAFVFIPGTISTVSVMEAQATVDALRDELRGQQIAALVHDVLADANTRASLSDSALASGWDDGFFIASADGSFTMNLSAQVQVRFVANLQDDDEEDTTRWGFENRRTKIGVKGHVIDSSWTYKIKGSLSRSSGQTCASDVWIEKSFDNGVAVTVGQFNPPFLHEELVGNTKQLCADRSLHHAAFNPERAQGVQVAWSNDHLRAAVMLHDGFDSRNSQWSLEDSDIALTGRLEWILAGARAQFKDFTSRIGDPFGCQIGAALHYERGESGTVDDEEQLWSWTADFMIECDGWSLSGGVTGRRYDLADTNPWGGFVQVGVPIAEDTWDAFARYAFGDADDETDDLSVITVGFNRYFHGHDVKLTCDLGYAFNTVSDAWASSSRGWREDETGADGQTVLRAQLQLLF